MNYNRRNHRLKVTGFIKTQSEIRAGTSFTDTILQSTRSCLAMQEQGKGTGWTKRDSVVVATSGHGCENTPIWPVLPHSYS